MVLESSIGRRKKNDFTWVITRNDRITDASQSFLILLLGLVPVVVMGWERIAELMVDDTIKTTQINLIIIKSFRPSQWDQSFGGHL